MRIHLFNVPLDRLLLLLFLFPFIHAQPLSSRQLVNPNTGSVFDPSGQTSISQSPATDGGGVGYSLPSILWIIFCSAIGAPLALAGVRGWRVTSGVGLGLSLSILMWCALVNTMSTDSSLSDIILSTIIWISFLVGLAGGFWHVGTSAGVPLLGGCAGVALGILFVLVKPGLLFPVLSANLVPLAILACAGGAWHLFNKRLAVIVSSSTCGSFLLILAVDLSINKQQGIARGLVFLLDRNIAHLGDNTRRNYRPPILSLALVGIAFGLVPVFSFLQSRFWKEPFERTDEALAAYREEKKGKLIEGPAPKNVDDTPGSEDGPRHAHMRFPSVAPTLPGKEGTTFWKSAFGKTTQQPTYPPPQPRVRNGPLPPPQLRYSAGRDPSPLSREVMAAPMRGPPPPMKYPQRGTSRR